MNAVRWKEKWEQLWLEKKKFIWMVVGGVAIVVAVGVLVLSRGGNGSAAQAQTVHMDVTRGTITETIDVVGSLEASPSVILSWESDGIVNPFNVEIGDEVEKDQVLIDLDESTLTASILQAQSDLLDAQVALQNLELANTDLYEAAQVLADAEYELRGKKTDRDYWNSTAADWDAIYSARDEYYQKEQIVWERESAYQAYSNLEADDPQRLAAYEAMRDAKLEADTYLHYLSNMLGSYYDHAVETDLIEYDQAQAAVEEARIAYNRYLDQTQEISAAQANVQALQNTVNQSKIIAPFGGTVTDISAVTGEQVSAESQAVRIDDLDNLLVDVYVSEVDINRIAVGQPAVLSFDALTGQEFEGAVQSIASAGTSDSGVVEFRVTVKLVEADPAVKPGFTAVVSIITSSVENALLVPSQAITTVNGKTAVMLVQPDGTAKSVLVELGASSESYNEVISDGLAEGDQLVVTISTADDLTFDGAIMRQMTTVTNGAGPGGGGQRGQ